MRCANLRGERDEEAIADDSSSVDRLQDCVPRANALGPGGIRGCMRKRFKYNYIVHFKTSTRKNASEKSKEQVAFGKERIPSRDGPA